MSSSLYGTPLRHQGSSDSRQLGSSSGVAGRQGSTSTHSSYNPFRSSSALRDHTPSFADCFNGFETMRLTLGESPVAASPIPSRQHHTQLQTTPSRTTGVGLYQQMPATTLQLSGVSAVSGGAGGGGGGGGDFSYNSLQLSTDYSQPGTPPPKIERGSVTYHNSSPADGDGVFSPARLVEEYRRGQTSTPLRGAATTGLNSQGGGQSRNLTSNNMTTPQRPPLHPSPNRGDDDLGVSPVQPVRDLDVDEALALGYISPGHSAASRRQQVGEDDVEDPHDRQFGAGKKEAHQDVELTQEAFQKSMREAEEEELTNQQLHHSRVSASTTSDSDNNATSANPTGDRAVRRTGGAAAQVQFVPTPTTSVGSEKTQTTFSHPLHPQRGGSDGGESSPLPNPNQRVGGMQNQKGQHPHPVQQHGKMDPADVATLLYTFAEGASDADRWMMLRYLQSKQTQPQQQRSGWNATGIPTAQPASFDQDGEVGNPNLPWNAAVPTLPGDPHRVWNVAEADGHVPSSTALEPWQLDSLLAPDFGYFHPQFDPFRLGISSGGGRGSMSAVRGLGREDRFQYGGGIPSRWRTDYQAALWGFSSPY